MSRRAAVALAVALGTLGVYVAWPRRHHRSPPPPPVVTLAPGQLADLDRLPTRAPRWAIQLDDPRGPDLVAHRPLVVGDRVIVAGSRVGWAGLALADGAVAWRRRASPALAPPLLVDRGLLLVDTCPADTIDGHLRPGLACAVVVEPATGAIVRALSIFADDVAGCAPALGAWRLQPSIEGRVLLGRGACWFEVSLVAGAAHRLADRAPPVELDDPDRVVVDPDQPPWRRELVGGRPVVIDPSGARVVPGLLVLAADPGGPGGAPPPATVVRLDGSLRNDAVIGGGWWWRLPEPLVGRGDPMAIASAPTATVVLFDGDRVAAFAP